MYNDLFKFFENDTESIRTTIKRTAPTQPESHERKHRFRKVLATRQPSLDMKYRLRALSISTDPHCISLVFQRSEPAFHPTGIIDRDIG